MSLVRCCHDNKKNHRLWRWDIATFHFLGEVCFVEIAIHFWAGKKKKKTRLGCWDITTLHLLRQGRATSTYFRPKKQNYRLNMFKPWKSPWNSTNGSQIQYMTICLSVMNQSSDVTHIDRLSSELPSLSKYLTGTWLQHTKNIIKPKTNNPYPWTAIGAKPK